MKRSKSIGLTAIILIGGTMSFSTADSPTPDEVALWKVARSTNDFSKQFFKALVDENKGNLIVSPLSAAVVLAMASYGAGGNTKIQMKSALHLPEDNDSAKSGFRSLMDKFNNVQNVELRLANRIFVNKKFPVKEDYQNLTSDVFRSVTEQVPFAEPAVAANIINTFCQKQTNNRIQNIVSEFDLDGATMMVLINAVYFKGTWLEKFDPQFTQDMRFHVDEKQVIYVPTMYKKASLKYGVVPALKASFIELPYKGEEFSMVIILPNEINGLTEMIPKLTEVDIGTVLQSGRKQDVKVYLPKFRVESSIDLGNPLMQIGMQDLFTVNANFSGISDVPLMVSKVVQKAFIEVNEDGSEAAAVTAAQLMRISMPAPPMPIVQMKIDRPYHFLIIHVPSNTVFFEGIVMSPKFSDGS